MRASLPTPPTVAPVRPRPSTLVLALLLALLTPGPTAAAEPAESLRTGSTSTGEVLHAGPGFEVRATPGGEFLVELPGRISHAGVHVLRVDGEAVGIATPQSPTRAGLVTTDARVLTARVITVDGLVGVRRTKASLRRDVAPHSWPWGATRRLHPELRAEVVGELPVLRGRYDLGDQALAIGENRYTELVGELTWPARWPAEQAPLVVILHGQHQSCESATEGGSAGSQWPCGEGVKPYPSEQGYREMADALARSGFVVSSVRAGGVNYHTLGDPDLGASARARLLEAHIRILQRWSAEGGAQVADEAGPLDPQLLRGRIDPTRTGLVGHSRGGEGAVAAAVADEGTGRPLGIRAVVAIAPTNFSRWSLRETDLGVILGGCDGDVSDLQGAGYLADAARDAPGRARRWQVLLPTAGHNGFNTVWEASGDDRLYGPDPRCHGPATGPAPSFVSALYTTAMLRRSLRGEAELDAMLRPRPALPSVLRRIAVEVSGEHGSPLGRWRAVPESTIRDCTGADTTPCPHDSVGMWAVSVLSPRPYGVRAQQVGFTQVGGASVPVSLTGARTLSLQAWAPPGVRGVLRLRDARGGEVRAPLVLPRLSERPRRSYALSSETRVELPAGLVLSEVRTVEILLTSPGAGEIILTPLRVHRGEEITHPASLPRIELVLPGQRPTSAHLSVPREGSTSEGGFGGSTPGVLRLTRALSVDEVVGIEVHGPYERDPSSGAVRRHLLQVRIPAGSREVSFAIPTGGDDRDDLDRNAYLALSGARTASIPTPLHLLRVEDDDPTPTVSCTDAAGREGEHVTVELRASAPSNQPLHVHVEVQTNERLRASDLQLLHPLPARAAGEVRGSAQIQAGAREGQAGINLLADDEVEGTETAVLRCLQVAGEAAEPLSTGVAERTLTVFE